MKALFRRPIYRSRGANSGNAVIEFALILPLLLLVVFGITELGRAIMTVNVLTQAAREGARVAAVIGADSTAVTARVMEVLDAANVTPAAGGITIVGPDANKAITVTVETEFKILSAKVLTIQGVIRLKGSTVMRFEG